MTILKKDMKDTIINTYNIKIIKMNYFKLIVIIIATVFISNAATAQKTNQKAVIKTAFTCDHCKVCETCGQLFNDKLMKIKGVKMIELDDVKMTITVYFNSKKTNLLALKTAISKLGYDADDIKADPIGYEKLDGCCKV
jgi:mercuric ion binding protein